MPLCRTGKELAGSWVVWNGGEDMTSPLSKRWLCCWNGQDFAWPFNSSNSVSLRRFFCSNTPHEAFQLWQKARMVMFPVMSETSWEPVSSCQISLITRSGLKLGIWRDGGRVEVMEKLWKLSFQTSNFFSAPIMNEDWNWLFFYWLEKGIVVV